MMVIFLRIVVKILLQGFLTRVAPPNVRGIKQPASRPRTGVGFAGSLLVCLDTRYHVPCRYCNAEKQQPKLHWPVKIN